MYIEAEWARRNPDSKTNDKDHIAALRKLVAAYPDDEEAKSILGLALLDGDSGRVRPLLPVVPPFSHRISRDGRTLLIERPGLEADLWLMEMGK